jgi:hypothetical protein
MDAKTPEEIQEKLKIIEKEADFSHKIPHPIKWWIVLLGSAGLLILSIGSTVQGDSFKAVFSFAIAILFFAHHLEYKQLYNLHSNARDIINYYRNRENK